jgi:glycosyltransferase involved in cell wall biosynthesis
VLSRVRVLHVITEMGTGGAESLVVELVRRGAEIGWDSAVASAGGSKADELLAAGVPHFVVPAARRRVRGILRARSATARAVTAFGPDIIVAHNVSASFVTWLARPQVPVLTVFHGVADADYRNAARVLSRTSDHVVAVAQVIANRLTAAGLRGVKTSVIPNAVTPGPLVSRVAARESLGLPDETLVGLCLARMVPQKRHDVLLKAWAQLPDNAILLLAGDGPLRDDLEGLARSMSHRVRFLGNRTDVSELLAAADLTVLTSDWEGLPMALLESLASGRPAVATDVDGVREILARGGGRLVPPGDVGGVVTALRELLQDTAARTQAAEAGLATIKEFYNPSSMVIHYDQTIAKTLRGKDLSWAS